MSSFKPVIALSRGLAVLRAVNDLQPATVGSIHGATGLDKATIVRMLETLQHEQLVTRGTARHAYVPTGRTKELARGFNARSRLGELADPILRELGARFGWPAFVSILDVDAMLLVQSGASNGPLALRRRPGYRAPMLVTASGRAYLAFCPQAERDQILERLAQQSDPWARTARQRAQLRALFDEVAHTGFATTDEDYSESEHEGALCSMAVPVMTQDRLYGSLNLVFIRSAVSEEKARARFLQPLQSAAERLAHQLQLASISTL